MHLFGRRSYSPPPLPISNFTISADRTDWNLLTELGYTPTFALDVTITIATDKVVRSTNVSRPGMDLSGLFTGSTLSLVIGGVVHGRGGDGANASASDGADGGDAIKGPGAGVTFSITNGAGHIYGGGGGGASGGNAIDVAEPEPAFAGGGGGGGGAGGSRGGTGGVTGGEGANNGAAGGNSTTGLSGSAGAGGTGGSVPGVVDGGAGGDGGEYGVAGSPGASGSHGTTNHAGGDGGAAGKAINLNGGSAPTWVSGNTAARVKGAVS